MRVKFRKVINMYGQDYSSNGIEIRPSLIHGKGVFACKEYPAHSDVAYFEGYEIGHDTRHSLTLDGHKIKPTGLLKYLNHSCNPNCYFRERVLVTKQRTYSGQELTIDYSATEENISYCFECNCKSSNCRGKI